MTQATSNHSNTDSEIKIYVACLAAYNNAQLYGAWIDATQEPDDIMGEVQAMLKKSPQPDAEEWAIHDYEGFCGIKLSKWEGFEQVHDYAAFIEEHGELGAEVWKHFDDLDEARTMLDDNYAGCYRSVADFAEELTAETTQIPKSLTFYIDYDRMGRDMDMSGDILTIETAHDEVHIFWSR